jgi:hypothetical protein
MFDAAVLRSPQTYPLFLASSTKFPVKADDEIVLPPEVSPTSVPSMTYDQATIRSLAARVGDADTIHRVTRVVVPPIIVPDGTDFGIPREYIKPSQLHPFLLPENLEKLRTSPTNRGNMFELPFLYAVYARYLLVSWGSQNAEWVPLTSVFRCALLKKDEQRLTSIEICLKAGVDEKPTGPSIHDAKPNAVTWTAGVNSNAHHDAYIWCRKRNKNGQSEEHAMALQFRHGQPKTNSELDKELLERRRTTGVLKLPLFVVYADKTTQEEGARNWSENRPQGKKGGFPAVVFVDASAMSSCSWLTFVSQQAGARKP